VKSDTDNARSWTLFVLFSAPNVTKTGQIKEDIACMRVTVRETERKKPLGRASSKWEINIKMDLREIGWEDVNLIDLDQDRNQWRAVVNMIMNLRVP
jgi:hypothetical protein